MRILLLAQFYPPDVGGEERHVQGLARALTARGHSVSVLTQALDRTPSVQDEDGVRVHRVLSTTMRLDVHASTSRPHAPPFPDPEVSRAIRRVAIAERPDVVHAHNWIVFSAVAALRTMDLPLVLTLHDYGFRCATQRMMYLGGELCSGPGLSKCVSCARDHFGLPKGVVTALGLRAGARLRARALSHVVAVSRSVAELNALEDQSAPWTVVPNFVPDDTVTRAATHARRDGLPEGDYIAYVGELHPEKGTPDLLAAYEGLPAPRPPLVCVGQITADLGRGLPDGVVLTGRLPHDEVMAVLAHSLFAVVPSRWPDPCPTTTLEAMAAGRAVVGTRTGGLVDQIVEGRTGVLVQPGDAGDLGRGLRTLLDDRTLASAMGRAARERIGAFTADAVATRLEEIYAGVRSAVPVLEVEQ